MGEATNLRETQFQRYTPAMALSIISFAMSLVLSSLSASITFRLSGVVFGSSFLSACLPKITGMTRIPASSTDLC